MIQQDWVDQITAEEEEMEAVDEYESALGQAMSIWQRGNHIPLDMYHKLLEEGFDVPRLEARYFIH